MRRETIPVKVGNLIIGGKAPISIQSMTKTKTEDVEVTLQQIKELEEEGCELVRVAVPHEKAARALKDIVRESSLPIVADIHFSFSLGLLALEQGVHKLRINPGNMKMDEVVKIAEKARDRRVSIRLGINSGSLSKEVLSRFAGATPQAMVYSALRYIEALENIDFRDIVISLKASDVRVTVSAYKMLAGKVQYPFHLGVTEAGGVLEGTVKSSIGIGSLLLSGIGDTIRVSLTADPVEEVKVAKNILQALNLRTFGPEIISCPTCGRCDIDLIPLVEEITECVKTIKKPLKIAVMGCVVNGPGEAKEADIGISGGRGFAFLFKKGEIVRKVPQSQVVDVLMDEISQVNS